MQNRELTTEIDPSGEKEGENPVRELFSDLNSVSTCLPPSQINVRKRFGRPAECRAAGAQLVEFLLSWGRIYFSRNKASPILCHCKLGVVHSCLLSLESGGRGTTGSSSAGTLRPGATMQCLREL